MPEPLLEALSLTKTYANGVKAVDDVNLVVHAGETVGLVGESGCGKSTTAKMLLRLVSPDSGSLRFGGADVLNARGRKLKELRKRLQVVPQNPQTSMNPRLTIRQSVEFNLRAHSYRKSEWRPRVDKLLDQVGLDARRGESFPHELSGGQLQRAAIARALATEPDLVICDEAVSALDQSVQAQVLNLLSDLQEELNVAYLFISHDLSVVRHISDRILVMYLGRIVEEGPADLVWSNPAHPYTARLFSAIPGSAKRRVPFQSGASILSSPPQ